MDCHVAWMGGAVTLGDFFCEALVGSISGQRRKRMLEAPGRLTSVTKESLADPWYNRPGSQKCPVGPESRSRDGCSSAVVLDVKDVGEDDSEGGEEDTKKCDTRT